MLHFIFYRNNFVLPGFLLLFPDLSVCFAESSNNSCSSLPFLVLNPKVLLHGTSNMKRQPTLWFRTHQRTPVATFAYVALLRPPLLRNLGTVDPFPSFRIAEKHFRHEQRAHHVRPRALCRSLHCTVLCWTQRATNFLLLVVTGFIFTETTALAEPVSIGDRFGQWVAVA